MKTQALSMIENCIDRIVLNEGLTEKEAFLRVLEYCGYKLGIPDTVIRFKQDTYDFMAATFSVQILKDSHWDWLGEVYEIIYQPAFNLSTKKSLDKHIDKCLETLNTEGPPTSIIDKAVGTGRFFIMLTEKMPQDQVLCYGIEADLVAYKICLLNAKLFNIPSKIFWCMNPKKYDLSSKSSNWKFANFWKPISEDRLCKALELR